MFSYYKAERYCIALLFEYKSLQSYIDQGSIIGVVKSSNTTSAMATSGSPVQSVYEEDLEVVDSKTRGHVEFLMGAFERLNKEHAVTNSSVATMEGKLTSIESVMSNLASSVQALMKSVGKMPIQDEDQLFGSSKPNSQVHRPLLEQSHSVLLGLRQDYLNLGNRESMLKKVEMPFCDGSKV